MPSKSAAPSGLSASPAGKDCGCPEDGPRGLSRRGFLGAAAAAGALGAMSTIVGEFGSMQLAYAGAGYTGDVLVVVSLRGGFDGLSAIVPAADPNYYAARPNIGIPSARLIPLDATFGMHPAMAPLKPLWDAGTFGVVHAVGQADPTRSHFDAMDQMERAAPGSSLRTGWINRMVGLTGSGSTFPPRRSARRSRPRRSSARRPQSRWARSTASASAAPATARTVPAGPRRCARSTAAATSRSSVPPSRPSTRSAPRRR
jgi:uncharacterized protein (DUF1501 family)